MKRKLLTLSTVLLVIASCTAKNEKKTTQWILTAQKPIICKPYARDGIGNINYTLISADYKVLQTGRVTLALPDTIK